MVIHHSQQLLTQLSELENKVQLLEKYIEKCQLEVDGEKIMRALIQGRRNNPSHRPGQKEN